MQQKTTSIEARFWSKVKIESPGKCWEWTAGRSHGYGIFKVGHQKIQASRYSLGLSLGRTLSASEFACHHCDNKGCVNPHHLYAGSPKDNSHDAVSRGRTGDTRGERNGGAKLTSEQVRKIREALSAGISVNQLVREYKVTDGAIRHIRDGRTWKNKT